MTRYPFAERQPTEGLAVRNLSLDLLSFLVDFDTKRVLRPEQGSLFGVIAETTPVTRKSPLLGHQVARFDWVGRPERTRLNNAHLSTADVVERCSAENLTVQP